ncbi:F-box/LRR-repeat protein 3-like [Trifolium pratense]|uniref:Uncharacterized protein n=1 Tax=Trifolium pratense TaxID=57577 RepID=A0ACB0KI77_TRIPR|nr:F-box/LRR-repeat protein 3-like [Trifolium pratense]CAJ2656353.1 unnamed protein product [Trifolium pratense]
MAIVEELYLPEECWECIFKISLQKYGDHSLNSLSVVSKQFLSITDRLKFSLTISNQTLPSLPRLLQRFTNLTSLDLSHFRVNCDVILTQLSCFPLQIKSLNLSYRGTIPSNGLQIFSQKITTLTSLICSNIGFFYISDLYLIANSFPLLEELDLSLPKIEVIKSYDYFDINSITLALPKLRKVNLSGCYYITNSSLFHLCKNCKFLEEVVMFDCKNLTGIGIASAIRERPNLRSFSITLSEAIISMELIDSLRSLKHLSCLDWSFSYISDQLLLYLADKGLNLRRLVLRGCSGYSYLLDLSHCRCISEGIVEVLRCCEIIHLNLSYCKKVNLSGMNFQVPKLEVLNLSFTRIDDKTLNAISKSCSGLLQLELERCYNITGKGVKQVVEKCTRLKEINLLHCRKVSADVDFWTAMVLLRPSLRKIIPPSDFRPSNSKRKPLFGRGCFRC